MRYATPSLRQVPRDARPAAREYALGHSQSELQRLKRQGDFLRDLTEHFLERAGLRDGMRVLDIGCGVGDVSLLAAELVGPTGSVLGIDRAPEAIETAQRRATASGLTTVGFATGDLDVLELDDPFDAIIGRLILMYLPQPAAVTRRLRRHLRSGGVMAFQEMAMPAARSVPEGPLFRRSVDLITATLRASGAECDMGPKLLEVFIEAGLPAPEMIALGRAEGGARSAVYDYVADGVRSLLPASERLGVATAAEMDVDTLAARLREEALRHRSCIMPPPLIGVWAQGRL